MFETIWDDYHFNVIFLTESQSLKSKIHFKRHTMIEIPNKL